MDSTRGVRNALDRCVPQHGNEAHNRSKGRCRARHPMMGKRVDGVETKNGTSAAHFSGLPSCRWACATLATLCVDAINASTLTREGGVCDCAHHEVALGKS